MDVTSELREKEEWATAREPDYHDDRGPRSSSGGVIMDMAVGAAAGALGVWAMDRLDWFMFDNEDPAARRQTEQVRPGGMDPAHVAANKVADMSGSRLTPSQPHPAAIAVHYSLGIGPGAIYGALRERVPYVGAGRGTLWGFALFALQDEGLNAISGLSADPRDYPWQAHARGLVAHLVYGAVTDTAISAMQGLLRSQARSRYR